MTLLQFANSECANFNHGECANISIADDLRMSLNKPLKQCALAENKPCKYFEDCVLPLAGMTTDTAKYKSYGDAVYQYRLLNKVEGKSRVCMDCGKPIGPRKQFCPVCTKKRQRERNRTAMAQKRDGLCINKAEKI
jgi:hypothetical protein